jgi:hypothetical protein
VVVQAHLVAAHVGDVARCGGKVLLESKRTHDHQQGGADRSVGGAGGAGAGSGGGWRARAVELEVQPAAAPLELQEALLIRLGTLQGVHCRLESRALQPTCLPAGLAAAHVGAPPTNTRADAETAGARGARQARVLGSTKDCGCDWPGGGVVYSPRTLRLSTLKFHSSGGLAASLLQQLHAYSQSPPRLHHIHTHTTHLQPSYTPPRRGRTHQQQQHQRPAAAATTAAGASRGGVHMLYSC